jgi:hypothetical protein
MCPDMTCVGVLSKCRSLMAYRPFKPIEAKFKIENTESQIGIDIEGMEDTTVETNLFLLRASYMMFSPPQKSPHWLNMTSGLKCDCLLQITPLAKSNLSSVTVKLNFNSTSGLDKRFKVSNMSVPNMFAVRSPVIRITTTGRKDDREYFGKPVSVRFNYDPIKIENRDFGVTKLSSYLCLAQAISRSSGENSTWQCVSRKIISMSDQDSPDPANSISQIEYEVPGPGVFAVVLVPDLESIKVKGGGINKYCGYFCQIKVDLIIYMLLIIPLLIWFFRFLDYL